MELQEAARLIRKGKLVAFPTETVYGLGANALDAAAVKGIFDAKGRPSDNPCIIHVADLAMLRRVTAEISPAAMKLMKKFWPGPLTIILPRNERVPKEVSGGLSTVAVRMPKHDLALSLIRAAGVPIAAPSANRSGCPSPTTAAHVRRDFPGIPLLDGGPAEHGLESTVVSLIGKPRVLRPGVITLEQLRRVVPSITSVENAAESPGTRYKHYAPRKPLYLFHGIKKLQEHAQNPETVILCKDQHVGKFPRGRVVSLGKTDAAMGQRLYDALRTPKGKVLLVLGVRKRGLGIAIMDRLERAATKTF